MNQAQEAEHTLEASIITTINLHFHSGFDRIRHAVKYRDKP